jgi:hypothetical protein
VTAIPGATRTNLSLVSPLSDYGISSPVDAPQEIGTSNYENSVRFTCASDQASPNDIVYEVAGYKFLTATIGVPSNATNAAGNSMTITFFKDGSTSQLGKTMTTSLDHQLNIHLNLMGSSQLEIECSAITTATQNVTSMDVVLGNATIGPS